MSAAERPLPEPTPAADAPTLRAESLSVFLGARQLLDRVTLDIAPRRVTALIGASGCGKSAFLRALNRMNETQPGARTEGRVFFEGRDVYAPDADVCALRRRVGMVFRAPQMMPGTVFDNLAWGLRAAGTTARSTLAARVERALQRADLLDELHGRLDEPARALSPSLQQRLCVARALALDPEVLLLDEPASDLDPIATALLEDTLAALRETLAVVIVTHAMSQAARVSQTTAFFDHGRLVEVAPTNVLFTRPRERATEDYLTGRYG